MFENPKGSPFQIFRHYETVQNCHFSSDIRFSQYISTNIFFNTIRNLNVISGVKRYIRIFDVISEVYSVSLRRRRRFENKCSHLSQPLYPNFWSVFPARKASFGWNFFVSFSLKKRHEHILKILHFLSLRYSANFGRSRLVLYTAKFAYRHFFDMYQEWRHNEIFWWFSIFMQKRVNSRTFWKFYKQWDQRVLWDFCGDVRLFRLNICPIFQLAWDWTRIQGCMQVWFSCLFRTFGSVSHCVFWALCGLSQGDFLLFFF